MPKTQFALGEGGSLGGSGKQVFVANAGKARRQEVLKHVSIADQLAGEARARGGYRV